MKSLAKLIALRVQYLPVNANQPVALLPWRQPRTMVWDVAINFAITEAEMMIKHRMDPRVEVDTSLLTLQRL